MEHRTSRRAELPLYRVGPVDSACCYSPHLFARTEFYRNALGQNGVRLPLCKCTYRTLYLQQFQIEAIGIIIIS
jgi:hypothetical protein